MPGNKLRKNIVRWLSYIFHSRLNTPVNITYDEKLGSYTAYCNEINVTLIFSSCDESYYFPQSILHCVNYKFNESELFFSEGIEFIPVPTSIFNSMKRFDFEGDLVYVPFDFPGLVFWALSRLEEVNVVPSDEHDRFSARQSHAFKFNYLDRPIIDEWFLFLGNLISHQSENFKYTNSTYQLCLSHDVDRPMRYAFSPLKQTVKSLAADLIKRRKPLSLLEMAFSKVFSKQKLYKNDSFNTFNWICNVAAEYNHKNTFYFICGNTSNKDADYKLTHPAIKKLIMELYNDGHSIGLHPSYNTYLNIDNLEKELNTLKSVLSELNIPISSISSRMHYLRWKTPDTLLNLAKLGIEADSTLGYADYPGYRCGTSKDYTAVNPISGDIVNVVIQPLVIMEASLLASRYLGLESEGDIYSIIDNLMMKCKRVGGNFRVLWHNSELSSPLQKRVYYYLHRESNCD